MYELLELAENILRRYPLCDSCLGRQFGNLISETTNSMRGVAIKTTLAILAHSRALEGDERGVEVLKVLASNGMSPQALAALRKLNVEVPSTREGCGLCGGRLQQIENICDLIVEKLEAREFRSFLVGVRLPSRVIEAEDELRSRFGVKWGETIKSEFSREIGKALSRLTRKPVDYKNPDVVITAEPFSAAVEIQVNPLYVYGRYRKLVSGIPQSRWLCSGCGGKGCAQCEGSGKRYSESVQEIIAKPILEASGGEDAMIHAGGREDVDAKVLGRGRPFVLEVRRPKVRSINLAEVQSKINLSGTVEVEGLAFTVKDGVKRLKALEAAEKVYSAVVEVEEEISEEELRKVEEVLSGKRVKQATPLRVIHRRANKVREKYIYDAKTKRLGVNTFELTVRCQGGLYIKELIHSDEGRTAPSVYSILGKRVKCLALTVSDVSAGLEGSPLLFGGG